MRCSAAFLAPASARSVALGSIAIALLLPTLRTYRFDATNAWRGLNGLEPRVAALTLEGEVQVGLADWLRTHSRSRPPGST